MGDATVLSRLMRSTHRAFPTVPLLVVAKEISLEDVRLGLEKMPDRFYEHPGHGVGHHESQLCRGAASHAARRAVGGGVNWQEVRLTGNSAHEYAEQIDELEPTLSYGWQTKSSPSRAILSMYGPRCCSSIARTTSFCSTR